MSPAFSVNVVIFPRAEKARIATCPALNAVRASVWKRRVVGKASEDEQDGGACSANRRVLSAEELMGDPAPLEPGGGGEVDEDEE
jgi:hypothetical protein